MAGVTSNYPASIDSESNIIPPNNGDTLTVPGHWLAGNNGPIVNVQSELGTDPSGYAADVKTRLNDINPSEGNLNLDAGYGSKAPIYGVRAWVNFDGTGTVAIRESGNVSSVTDNGTGNYTVNFTNAMPDTSYSATTAINQFSPYPIAQAYPMNYYTDRLSVEVAQPGTANYDAPIICVAVIR